ncbi:hypothetical protein D3C76_1502410 [compost metagenome]
MNVTTAIIATRKDVAKPINIRIKSSELNKSRLSYKSNKLAPNITGTEIMNVKSAAAFWLVPSNRPPEIVEPDLENPGHNAKH